MTPPQPDTLRRSADRSAGTADFRERYSRAEEQRAALLARVEQLGDDARRHPVHGRALKLLNETFRKSSLSQRVGLLNAAAWMINLLEAITLSL